MFKKYGKQMFIALSAYMGDIVFGFSGGWPSPVVTKVAENPQLLGGINDTQLSFLISVVVLGCIVGSLPCGLLADRIGRKPVLMMGASLTPINYVCLALINDAYWLILFRGIIGVSVGCTFILNIVYLGEIGSTEIRGMLLGTTGIFVSVGFLVVYSVGPFVSYAVLNYIGFAISMVYLTGTFYMPESPIYFLKKARYKEAKAALIALNRKEDAEKLVEIKLEAEDTSVKWTKLFTVKCNRKALMITTAFFILQQLSGISPLVAYTSTIFDKSGSSIPPHIATIIIGVVLVLSGFITPLFIERYGRRFLLLTSTAISCVSLAVLSAYLVLDFYGNPVVETIRWLPLPLAIIHYVAYSFGLGIIPNALVGEMFELSLRSSGTSAAIFANWCTSFAVLQGFGYLVSRVAMHALFAFFSCMCAVAFALALTVVPETKGRTLVEVQEMLSR